ncbi:MAG TPA: hypothetical protein VHO03_12240 [Ignavibacteriales bacterium]|nr:hypothetical protein [Ignavibacteriales bacterium]
MLKSKELTVNEFIIEEAIDYLLAHGFSEISANLPGFPQPEKIVSQNKRMTFIPDVIAERHGDSYLFAVETGDLYLEGPVARKWKEFAHFAERNNMTFHIVVPRGILRKVDLLLTKLGITAVVHQVLQ